MSLVVWLPLTKDLRNQGLSNLSFTNYGGSYLSNGGKLGGCYSFSGSGTASSNEIASAQNCPITGDASYSIAFWFYWGGDSWSNDYVGVVGWGNQSTATGAWACLYNGRPDLDFWNCRYIATNQLSVKTWYHVVFTKQSGTGMGGHIYVNGVEVAGSSVGLSTPNIASNKVIIGRLNSAMASRSFNGKVCDVRIYDHCLSPMEVKELSKGLVLHYPLTDAYVEATTNLSNSKLSSSCYNAVTQKYSYGTSTDIYKESGTFEGRVCEKVHMGTNGLDAFPYVFFDYFQPPIGETRTLSFDYYPTIMDKVVFYSYNSPGNGNYTINYKAPVSWSGSVAIPVQLNQWNHITITVTNTGSAASGYGYMQIGNVKHTSNTTNYWLFGNIQVEAKDHATGYVGPNGTRSTGTVYDCSGLCNNGIVYKYDNNGDIVIDLNTPKYLSCTHIKAGNPTEASATGLCYIYSNCALTTPNQLTVSFWCKPIHNYQDSTSRQGVFCTTNDSIGVSAGTDYNTTAMHHRDSLIDVCQDSGTWNTINTPFVVGEWHYYTFIYNGKKIQWYKDGTFQSEKAFDNTGNLKSFSAIVIGFTKAGGVYRKNDCYMSDFRIYATALSADDVKSLYQNSAYIDSSGNVYGAVHSEV